MDDSQKRYQEYLDFIKKYPKHLGYKGDYKKGEIEVVSDVSLFFKCEEESAKRMVDSGVSFEDAKKRAEIGVFDQNRWGLSVHMPLKLPDGGYTTFNRWLSWGTLDSGCAGVVMVPSLADGRLIFIKTFRNATRNWCIEFPRGSKDPGSSVLNTVKNELSEEMGASIIEDPKKLGEIFPDSGVLASRVEIFSVKIKITGAAEHEFTEAIKGLIFVSEDRLKELVRTQEYTDSDGKKYEFKDAYTLSALALLDTHSE